MTTKRINMAELADGVAQRATIPVSYAEKFVQAVFDLIEEALVREKLVKVKGLGTFKLVDVEPRESVDVNTGERILLAAHSKVTFTPDATLRDTINRPFADFETVILNEGTPTEQMETTEGGLVQDEDNANMPISAGETNTEGLEEAIQMPHSEDVADVADDLQEIIDDTAKEIEENVAPIKEPQAVTSITEIASPDTVVETKDAESGAGHAVASQFMDEPSAHSNATESVVLDSAAPVNVAESVVLEPLAPANAQESVVSEPSAPAKGATTPNEEPIVTKETRNEPVYESKNTMIRHILLNTLAAILCMFIGYAMCYYFRPFELPTLTPAHQENAVEKARPATDNKTSTEAAKQTEDSIKAIKAEPSPAKNYPQLEGGDYEIVGVQGTEVMSPGKTLLNISLKYFKSTDFVPYICKLNGIENPDIVPLDKELQIPELKHK